MRVRFSMDALEEQALRSGAPDCPVIPWSLWHQLPGGGHRPARPWVIAHRGSSAEAPENTLAAFRLAATQGADAIELDVRRCGSGQLVVFHDADLKRLAASSLAIADSDLKILRGFDLGGGERIPTLEEVLIDPDCPPRINIEIKADTAAATGIEAVLVELLLRTGTRSRVIVSSFNPLVLRRLKRLDPDIPRGFLYEPRTRYRLLKRPYLAPIIRPHLLHPVHSLATAAFVSRAHALGYGVLTWTVDEAVDWARLMVTGVDGIITNRPAGLVALLQEMPGDGGFASRIDRDLDSR